MTISKEHLLVEKEAILIIPLRVINRKFRIQGSDNPLHNSQEGITHQVDVHNPILRSILNSSQLSVTDYIVVLINLLFTLSTSLI